MYKLEGWGCVILVSFDTCSCLGACEGENICGWTQDARSEAEPPLEEKRGGVISPWLGWEELTEQKGALSGESRLGGGVSGEYQHSGCDHGRNIPSTRPCCCTFYTYQLYPWLFCFFIKSITFWSNPIYLVTCWLFVFSTWLSGQWKRDFICLLISTHLALGAVTRKY